MHIKFPSDPKEHRRIMLALFKGETTTFTDDNGKQFVAKRRNDRTSQRFLGALFSGNYLANYLWRNK